MWLKARVCTVATHSAHYYWRLEAQNCVTDSAGVWRTHRVCHIQPIRAQDCDTWPIRDQESAEDIQWGHELLSGPGDIKTLVTPWWGSGWSSWWWWWWPWPEGRGWPSPASARISWSGGGRRSTWLVKLIRWQPLTFKSSIYIYNVQHINCCPSLPGYIIRMLTELRDSQHPPLTFKSSIINVQHSKLLFVC